MIIEFTLKIHEFTRIEYRILDVSKFRNLTDVKKIFFFNQLHVIRDIISSNRIKSAIFKIFQRRQKKKESHLISIQFHMCKKEVNLLFIVGKDDEINMVYF